MNICRYVESLDFNISVRYVLWPCPVSPVLVCSDTDIVRVGRVLCPHPASLLGPGYRFHNQEQFSDPAETRIPPGLLAIRGKNTPSLPPPEQNMVNKQQMPQETCDQPLLDIIQTRNILRGCNVTLSSGGFIRNVTSAWETTKSQIIWEQGTMHVSL